MPKKEKIRFELWNNGFRRNIAAQAEGEQNEEYEMIKATLFTVGVSSNKGREYEMILSFDTAEKRRNWIESYKLLRKMQ